MEDLWSIDETIRQIGELSAIVILFIAGLEITPRDLEGGAPPFTVGSIEYSWKIYGNQRVV